VEYFANSMEYPPIFHIPSVSLPSL